MGRNFHSTKDYEFRDSSGKHGPGTGGQLVMTDKATGRTLLACFNDSFEDAVLAAYWAGHHHGERYGRERLQRDLCAALGISSP